MSRTAAETQAFARVARLITNFDTAQGEARAQILDAFREKGPEGVQAVLDLIKEEEARRNVSYRVAGLAIIALVTFGIIVGRSVLGQDKPSPILLLPIVGSFVLLLFLARYLLPNKTEKNARILLACLHESLENTGAIGPLLEAFGEYVDDRLNTWNMLALLRLLPTAKPGDIYALTVRQRSALYRILTYASAAKNLEKWRNEPGIYVDVLVALLRAASLRPEEDIRLPVRNLAGLTPHTEPEKRVQEAAAACLALLEAKSIKQHEERHV